MWKTGSTITPNRLLGIVVGCCIGLYTFRFLRLVRHVVGQQDVSRLQPSTTPQRSKLEDAVHGYFNVGTLVNGCGTKVRHEYLEDTDVAHDQCHAELLFDIDNDGIEAVNQIAVTFASGESWKKRNQSGER